MIWRSFRDGLIAEFFAWAGFLFLSVVMGMLGARANSRWTADVLGVVWFALFLGIYIFLHHRRKQCV